MKNTNMKKIFFLDIDGTIIDGSRNMFDVSEKTKYAINELVKDNYVVISSGRCRGLLDENILNLNNNGYILCNGSYAEIENKELYSLFFEDDVVEKIKEVSIRNNGFYILETLDGFFVNDLENKAFKAFISGWGKALPNFKYENIDADKYYIAMIGFDNYEDSLKANEELKDICSVDRHNNSNSFDINIKNVNKGTGVTKLREYLNIPIENTYAFGDGINDLQMLQAVGNPVIMKNANPELKKYNFYETDDVLDDGVYNYLLSNKLIKAI